MDTVTLEVISMTELMSHGDSGVDLIPDVPAIYLWTIDITRLKRLSASSAQAELLRLLYLPLRAFSGRVTPYYTTEITDHPNPLSADRSAKLGAILDAAGATAAWLLLQASALQRPLYVGQTVDLNRRLRSHLRPTSLLRGYLHEAGLTMRDCSLAFVRIPDLLALPTRSRENDEEDVSDDEEELRDGDYQSAFLDVLEALLHRWTRPLLARKIE